MNTLFVQAGDPHTVAVSAAAVSSGRGPCLLVYQGCRDECLTYNPVLAGQRRRRGSWSTSESTSTLGAPGRCTTC
jgi:hypothetical protein